MINRPGRSYFTQVTVLSCRLGLGLRMGLEGGELGDRNCGMGGIRLSIEFKDVL